VDEYQKKKNDFASILTNKVINITLLIIFCQITFSFYCLIINISLIFNLYAFFTTQILYKKSHNKLNFAVATKGNLCILLIL